MKSILAQAKRWDWVLIAILAMGLALRLWGIGFGLPFMFDVDESRPVNSALQILNTGNLDPGFFIWPSFLMYLNAAVYFVYFLFNSARGSFVPFGDLPYVDIEGIGIGMAPSGDLMLLGRGLTAIFGVLSIVVVFLIANRIREGKWAGWFAALLLAIESINVRQSHFIRPDVIATFFALVAFYFALRILDEPRLKYYILAGIAAGLAAGTKYNLAIIVVSIATVHLIKYGVRSPLRGEIWIAAAASMLTFFCSTPYAVLNWRQFISSGIVQDVNAYLPGDALSVNASIVWYSNLLWSSLGIAVLLAIGGAVHILVRRDKKGIAILTFLAVYLVFINSFIAHVDGNMLPAIPFLCVLAGLFIETSYNFLQRQSITRRKWVGALVAVFLVLLVLPPLSVTATNDYRISLQDGRYTANEWISQNLASGSRVALESWSPYVDRHKFALASFGLMVDHTPDWYVSNGFEYLVFSQGSYGRSQTNPERYAALAPRYDAFFSRFTQVARFDDNDFEIRIFKTDARLPAHRVGARFGDNGNLIELVGYDESDWQVGKPLHVTLYWRDLAAQHEPLQLETRLLGDNDKEIVLTQNDLFLGKGWQPGMFPIDWVAPVPDDITPGSYRLKINVAQPRFNNYHPPAMNSADEMINDVILGPFTLTANQ
ncbi:MAG: glycosyltransferase family 39 protein [Chloroflexota bacterium]|nr:glycosyltransferase family 39 protein [Chloroflexota bacterium]